MNKFLVDTLEAGHMFCPTRVRRLHFWVREDDDERLKFRDFVAFQWMGSSLTGSCLLPDDDPAKCEQVNNGLLEDPALEFSLPAYGMSHTLIFGLALRCANQQPSAFNFKPVTLNSANDYTLFPFDDFRVKCECIPAEQQWVPEELHIPLHFREGSTGPSDYAQAILEDFSELGLERARANPSPHPSLDFALQLSPSAGLQPSHKFEDIEFPQVVDPYADQMRPLEGSVFASRASAVVRAGWPSGVSRDIEVDYSVASRQHDPEEDNPVTSENLGSVVSEDVDQLEAGEYGSPKVASPAEEDNDAGTLVKSGKEPLFFPDSDFDNDSVFINPSDRSGQSQSPETTRHFAISTPPARRNHSYVLLPTFAQLQRERRTERQAVRNRADNTMKIDFDQEDDKDSAAEFAALDIDVCTLSNVTTLN